MQRRMFLSGLVGGSIALSGCTSNPFSDGTPRIYNPTGMATIRSLDEPIIQHGLTADSEQYLYAEMFHSGDTLSVTDQPDAEQYSEAIDGISGDEFAILTNLRTTSVRPAYFWPANTEWRDGRLKIILERQTGSYDGTADEVVGVALTIFNFEGESPAGADIVFPSGATLSVGSKK